MSQRLKRRKTIAQKERRRKRKSDTMNFKTLISKEVRVFFMGKTGVKNWSKSLLPHPAQSNMVSNTNAEHQSRF